MTTTVQISWMDLIHRADPDFDRASTHIVEYEFTTLGSATGPNAHLTHQDGYRVFRGNYRARGAYGADGTIVGGLTWGGEQITWGGDEITWGNR